MEHGLIGLTESAFAMGIFTLGIISIFTLAIHGKDGSHEYNRR